MPWKVKKRARITVQIIRCKYNWNKKFKPLVIGRSKNKRYLKSAKYFEFD